jgi:molybdenum cofactor cytidylyltransferase
MQLREALDLGPRELVTFVGGGGKTTAMYRLARETVAAGGRAIATGTTLFTPPPAKDRLPIVFLDESESAEPDVARAVAREPAFIVATGHGTKGRLLPVPADLPARLLAIDGVQCIAVEGDGSRGRAFKAPAAHEPVIPPGATLVVAVAGMSVLGQPLDDEHVHRPEQVRAVTGIEIGAPVTIEMMAAVLASERGGRRSVPADARYLVLLNHVEPDRLAESRALAELLLASGILRVVLARLRDDPPVVDVLA